MYRDKAHHVGRSGSPLKIVDSLFEKPVLSIPDAASIADVTYPAAAAAIAKLVEVGILREMARATQPKRFIAPEVVMISAGLPLPRTAFNAALFRDGSRPRTLVITTAHIFSPFQQLHSSHKATP